MNRYKLRANYNIDNIDSHKVNGTVVVDVPMLSNGKLNYGLSNIKKRLYKEHIYPSSSEISVSELSAKTFANFST